MTDQRNACPFCGGRVIAHRGMYARTPPDPRGLCEECGAYGPKRGTEDEAIGALCYLGRVPHAAHSERVIAALRAMTPEQARRTLVDAGIYDQDGNLTEPYRE